MTNAQEFVRRQKALAEFGEFVLDHDDLQQILQEGCRIIADTLCADYAKIVEIDRASNSSLVVAGVGWRPGIVGEVRLDLGGRSSEAYAIQKGEPIITRGVAHEDRFEFPDFMIEHGVVSIVNVPISLPGRRPYGLLQVDAREPRDFGDEDVEFLRTYAMVLGPVIDRLRAVTELEHSGERLRLITENARGYTIVLSDPNDIITDWLAGSEQIFGWTAEEVIGKPVAMLFTEEDRAAGAPEWEVQVARQGGAAPDVRWHARKDGSKVFLDGQTVALRDGGGEVRGYLKIGQDVTERKRAEERQAVLLAELQHRVRNVLAMVRSVVRRTVRNGSSIEQIGEELEGRIDALARTQALLTRALNVGVDLETMVREELAAQSVDESVVTVAGQPVKLAAKAAEVLTLAVHELSTNAVKYGALGREGGRLHVEWRVDARREPALLCFSWRESGVTLPGQARQPGFGTELITRRVPYELKGRGQLNIAGDGAECLIEFPLVERESIFSTGSPP